MDTYLGLGSNLGDRKAHILQAIEALAKLGRVAAISTIYETSPEGGAAQPDYLNAAVRLDTDLPAHELMKACLEIEARMGRIRPKEQAKASRTIDIDLLLYGHQVVDEPDLTVPHPSLLLRPFVRIPLCDVAMPGLRHPVRGERLDECIPDPSVRPFAGFSSRRLGARRR
jgi:2-amino-4-hydroxy-6-hydroxymethyldihydropteridine diphosphokinase